MRIVHIHMGVNDAGGGGGIAMFRLHQALVEADIDSRILAQKVCQQSPEIARLPVIRLFAIERKLRRFTSRLGLNDVHRLGSFKLAEHDFCKGADVLHFHGTHSGSFSYLAFPKVSRSIPCVHTLHDMWAVTGHCAYSFECDRWKTGCGSCPHPETSPPIRRDATRLEWKLKNWAYGRSDLSLITKSRWMTEVVEESMLSAHRVDEIPYGLRTDVFRPRDRLEARDVLGLPNDAYVLSFVAQNLVNFRKGGDLLVRVLRALPNRIRSKTHLLTLGKNGGAIPHAAGLPVTELGYVTSDHLKALAYSAADLLLVGSRADNSPLVIMESQACGTPVVAFRTGGISERVRTRETGLLAEAEDAEGYATGVAELLGDAEVLAKMRRLCRETAIVDYSIERETRQHVDLYRELSR